MKETPRAQQAFNDYLAMDDRSLEKLCAQYQSAIDAPSKRLKTLADWSRRLNWQTRITEQVERERAAIEAEGIANRQNRVNDLQELRRSLLAIKAARAQSTLMVDVDGGNQGLMVAEPMLVKVYECGDEDSDDLTPTKQSKMAYKYALDTGFIKALLDVEKQAAVELGQWEEKSQVAGTVLIREVGADVGKL